MLKINYADENHNETSENILPQFDYKIKSYSNVRFYISHIIFSSISMSLNLNLFRYFSRMREPLLERDKFLRKKNILGNLLWLNPTGSCPITFFRNLAFSGVVPLFLMFNLYSGWWWHYKMWLFVFLFFKPLGSSGCSDFLHSFKVIQIWISSPFPQ